MRYVARFIFLILGLALLGLALTPTASPASSCEEFAARPVPYWWETSPAEPCGGDAVTLVFRACQENLRFEGYSWAPGGTLLLRARMPLNPSPLEICTQNSIEVPLGALAAGNYVYLVEVEALIDSTFCVVTRQDSIAFRVGCPEPPPGGALPFTQWIRIGPPPPCVDCPPRICPDTPIPFSIGGAFPSGCYSFRGMELLPSPIASPRPEPPIVRLYVDERRCVFCTLNVPPWSADTLLAALPPGTYDLPLEMVVSSSCGAAHWTKTYHATRSFTVLDSCIEPPPVPCVWADWVHSGDRCDDFIRPGGLATVTMTMISTVPLAGLQGTIGISPPGLLVANLEPVGRAAGMHIAWKRTFTGAEFVMFAEQGAPIGGLRCGGERCVEPVLAVSVLPDTDGVIPPVTHVTAGNLLGSDSLGNAVPQCQIETLVIVEARICAGPSCDFNQDGWLDVRDLVTMVHCLLGTGPCPDGLLPALDCDQDGHVDVDDVLCCAHRILLGAEQDTLPGRPEPSVAVRIGEASWEADGLRVPLSVEGADRLGAARLALTLPLDRYDVSGVELGAGSAEWLTLHEVVDGRLVVGLIGLGPATGAPAEPLPLTLRLTLKPGQSGGGEVSLADVQASGRDGVALEIANTPIAVPLPPPGTLRLSAARPNPFTHETSFTLNLDRGAEVELSVHDLSGRRVAVLFHGALGAGPHAFLWSGTRGDGSRAADGIYFVQATVGGERLARKVILLRGN